MVAVVMALSYWQFSHALQERAHQELTSEHRLIRKAFSQKPDITSMIRNGRFYDGPQLDHPGINIAVLPLEAGPALATHGDEGLDLATRVGNRNWNGVREFEWETCLLAAVIGEASTQNGKGYRLAVGIDRTADRDILSAHFYRLIASWFVCILLIGMLARSIASHSLQPLRKFSTQIAAISAQALERRIDEYGVPTELRQLAEAFNRVLANLGDSFSRLNALSSDIAHEMRGPLANMMAMTQVALRQSRTATEYQHALESNAEELERLTRMAEDMLFLARAENVSASITLELVDLHELCRTIADYYEIGARERGIQIDVLGHGAVQADVNLARRAIGNLLSNAVRYASASSIIWLNIDEAADGRTGIHVESAGAEIPPELVPRLFDRFSRQDMSRHRIGINEGLGLGLAIVRSIMTLHGGTVTYSRTTAGRNAFILRFTEGLANSTGLQAKFGGKTLKQI